MRRLRLVASYSCSDNPGGDALDLRRETAHAQTLPASKIKPTKPPTVAPAMIAVDGADVELDTTGDVDGGGRDVGLDEKVIVEVNENAVV
ncbi:uncharacterized protein PV07_06501 [Cladophialophora immunda]|uniref:Uncharacterized protein n=1 Tax=Cladophialophora immunda TaxID=569365 RepID=A0A0D2C690_9EURO|nr:uncharacterized protein PV07_06501 [Cladophialophora immunda]KIW26688.1 hypothetical protein PV07_06501 [Cladophialophora immunda]